MPNFQDNFGTNQTSNTLAGATTTPINSIPTVDAPYYIALDATNLNGHYEVVYVTSDTATNINHAATTYAHTTAEEVRLVVPASYLTAMQELEEGGMRNGKLSVTVGSNNLTVAIKTQDGGNPSVTEPVFVKIGGTLRTITSALSLTASAGTNWFNSGSAELATKEIDYFAYLFWYGNHTTPQVALGLSRIPFGLLGTDFSASNTNEKFAWYTIDGANAINATCTFVNIGRFAATLSAGAGYTWTVPTFTSSNLIQRPIYETRWLLWTPTITGFSSNPTNAVYIYKLKGNDLLINISETGSGTSNANTFTETTPFTAENVSYQNWGSPCRAADNGTIGTSLCVITANSNVLTLANPSSTSWTTSGAKRLLELQISIKI